MREVERFQARNRSFLDALLSMQLMAFLSAQSWNAAHTLYGALFLYGADW